MSSDFQTPAAVVKKRVASIDILRGLVMLFMLVDHVRERFFFHQNVGDPMDLDTTSPQLFFTRVSAHFCAPVFVFLTGLSAWLYSHPHNKAPRSATPFLFKRGLFIVFVEIAVINWLWMGSYDTLWLQVMWAIGISMIALSVLCKLPYKMILALGVLIVAGHNLLSPISFAPGETGYTLWAILHDRGFIFESESFRIKASYPVLPWIGVILLGFSMGPIYSRAVDGAKRQSALIKIGLAMWCLLAIIRGLNIYGEVLPWEVQQDAIHTVMSFINYTKYPPSLDYVLFTLGAALLVLAGLENVNNRASKAVETFGSAPMFYYILHLFILLVGYRIALNLVGPNYGDLFAFDHVWQVWLVAAVLALALYWPTKAFAKFKHNSTNPLVKYF
ncbi:DUF1624 domain-containing protein [Alteromonas confluentis]|uniref:Heparan-alpha-glucosaminide N-acetyltransferase catalytic domain-containing protein n=1 Tax=Alteromonas confluentis TaxID=1656094 RepID=A0A1E7Z6S6_9ALTE|nr:DUF1624 domain-containing protein [Alteromonas confluentis]OFC69210.1 hypothetical protein BFC18_21075 [Alteromonas confluentis]